LTSPIPRAPLLTTDGRSRTNAAPRPVAMHSTRCSRRSRRWSDSTPAVAATTIRFGSSRDSRSITARRPSTTGTPAASTPSRLSPRRRKATAVSTAPRASASGRSSIASSAPERLARFLGIVPNEHSSGTKHRQGTITKAGSGHARLLVKTAHHYRHPPGVGYELGRRQRPRIRAWSRSPRPAAPAPPLAPARARPSQARASGQAGAGVDDAARGSRPRQGPAPAPSCQSGGSWRTRQREPKVHRFRGIGATVITSAAITIWCSLATACAL
jgi:transposase IS116/IS110/IS902 family protein